MKRIEGPVLERRVEEAGIDKQFTTYITNNRETNSYWICADEFDRWFEGKPKHIRPVLSDEPSDDAVFVGIHDSWAHSASFDLAVHLTHWSFNLWLLKHSADAPWLTFE